MSSCSSCSAPSAPTATTQLFARPPNNNTPVQSALTQLTQVQTRGPAPNSAGLVDKTA